MSFVTLIIIIIVINLFSRLLEGSQQQQEKRNEQLSERLEHLRRNETSQTVEKNKGYSIFDEFDNLFEKQEPSYQEISLEEQRQKQLENLASRMDASLNPEEEADYENVSSDRPKTTQTYKPSYKSSVDKKQKMQKRIRNKLNKDGLVDSVIMAEVLGKPRSLKPYQNIFMRK